MSSAERPHVLKWSESKLLLVVLLLFQAQCVALSLGGRLPLVNGLDVSVGLGCGWFDSRTQDAQTFYIPRGSKQKK
jgi:hypothetical protein